MFPSPAQSTFRDTLTMRILAAIPLLIVIVIAVIVYQDQHEVNPVLWAVAGVSALPLLYACLWAAKRRITIHAEGISYTSLMNQTDLAWQEITETRYGQQQVNAYAHMGLIGLILSFRGSQNITRSFEIIGPKRIKLSSNIRDVTKAIRMVLEAVNPRLLKEAERTLDSGGTVAFGGISLAPMGVIWKGKDPLPYSSIVKCRIDGSFLRIKVEGKWIDNIAVSPKRVPNVFVMLDIIEKRRSAGLGQKTAAMVAGSSAGSYLS